jgi:hypothetical protein
MVPVMSLWIPIIVAAVLVFVVSSIIHMVLGYHNDDFEQVPNEDEFLDGLRDLGVPVGSYVFPKAPTMKAWKTPEFQEKMSRGPMGMITVWPGGPPKMGGSLAMWFGYAVLVGVFAAYVSGRALAPDAHYLSVFRFVGVTAFCCYGMALLQNSIWFKRRWRQTFVSMFDALIYALVTAGSFGWLWPG